MDTINHLNNDTHSLLNLNQKKLLKLSRINNIEDLILLSEWKTHEWNNKALNEETIKIATFIIENIKNILELNPENIKQSKIIHVINKLRSKLKKKWDCESCAIQLFMQNISLQISNALLRLERKQKNNDSLTDSLTTLVNRKWLDYEMEKQIELKNRNNTNFSVMLLDIDKFKQINDIYWHLVWDQTLVELAKILKENFRKNDIIWRWWWDELMIIMPKTEIFNAIDKANLIKEIIENNLSINKNIKELKVTVSIWVTQIENLDNPEIIMIKADAALYKCKTDWRNKVRAQLYSPNEVCNINCLECPHTKNCIKNKTT